MYKVLNSIVRFILFRIAIDLCNTIISIFRYFLVCLDYSHYLISPKLYISIKEIDITRKENFHMNCKILWAKINCNSSLFLATLRSYSSTFVFLFIISLCNWHALDNILPQLFFKSLCQSTVCIINIIRVLLPKW